MTVTSSTVVEPIDERCWPLRLSVEATVSLLDGKWKSVILFLLLSSTMRFGELHRATPDATHRVLTNQLRELEADGLIVRTIYAVIPPKVEYSISPLGRTLEPILLALKAWGDANMPLFGERRVDAAIEISQSVHLKG